MSAKIEKIIESIKRHQAEYAHAVLIAPPGRDAYEFGRVCGIYQGLRQAEQLINEAIGEPDDRSAKKLES